VRHAVFGRKLGRDINARKALASNLASSLLVKGHIVTTLAKAKFVKSYAEKLITEAKRPNLHTRRSVASRLTHEAFIRLITEIGPGFNARSGGYTRIIKLSTRRGDDAPMAKIEILDWDKSKTKVLTKSLKPAKKQKLAAKTKLKTAGKEKENLSKKESQNEKRKTK